MDIDNPIADAVDDNNRNREAEASGSNGQSRMEDAVMEVILEFQEVTGVEDIDESRQILDRYHWDLIAAINGHMGFEAPHEVPSPPSHNHNAGQSNISVIRRVNAGASTSNSISDGQVRATGAVRNQYPSLFMWVWKLVRSPVDLFFRIFWKVLGFGLNFIRGDPRRAITDPGQDVEDFIRQYEETYGTVHPLFFRGSYSQALQEAKRELKFLLAYLHCDDHIDTPAFCRHVMPHQGFLDLVRENMVFWGCSVSKPEGYKTSHALRENTYPFLALIVLKNHKMTVVKRIEGETDPEDLLTTLHQAVADNEAFLVAERQDRLERSMTQTLRQQQDEAYQASLKADQEKDRLKREAEQKKLKEEQEKLRLEEEELNRKQCLKQRKSEMLLNLKQEPPVDSPNVIKVVIKLPNGTRLERRFLNSDSLKHLYEFVFSHPQSPDAFEIATNFPKRTLPCKPDNVEEDPPSFSEFGLQRNEMLFVYDLES